MKSDKSSDKKQPPQKPTSSLPGEDPNLMLSISANQPKQRIEADEYRETRRREEKSSVNRSRAFPIITCFVILIGLVILAYFLFQYLR